MATLHECMGLSPHDRQAVLLAYALGEVTESQAVYLLRCSRVEVREQTDAMLARGKFWGAKAHKEMQENPCPPTR